MLVGRKIIRNASRCIAISPEEVSHLAEYGVNRSKIVMIPNGVDLEEFEESGSSALVGEEELFPKPFILFVGRLNYIKGPDILLQAFCNIGQRFPEYNLVFAGPDGGMLSRLRRNVEASSVSDRVHFVGYIAGEKKRQAYIAASLLVIPSRQEAMSIVVLEAGAAGTPVLLTDTCGFEDIALVDGGKVVPATVEGLQEGLAELLSKPEDLKRMGSRLRGCVSSRFTWDSIGQRYMALFQNVVGELGA